MNDKINTVIKKNSKGISTTNQSSSTTQGSTIKNPSTTSTTKSTPTIEEFDLEIQQLASNPKVATKKTTTTQNNELTTNDSTNTKIQSLQSELEKAQQELEYKYIIENDYIKSLAGEFSSLGLEINTMDDLKAAISGIDEEIEIKTQLVEEHATMGVITRLQNGEYLEDIIQTEIVAWEYTDENGKIRYRYDDPSGEINGGIKYRAVSYEEMFGESESYTYLESILSENTIGADLFNNERTVHVWDFSDEQQKYYEEVHSRTEDIDIKVLSNEILTLTETKEKLEYYQDYIKTESNKYGGNLEAYNHDKLLDIGLTEEDINRVMSGEITLADLMIEIEGDPDTTRYRLIMESSYLHTFGLDINSLEELDNIILEIDSQISPLLEERNRIVSEINNTKIQTNEFIATENIIVRLQNGEIFEEIINTEIVAWKYEDENGNIRYTTEDPHYIAGSETKGYQAVTYNELYGNSSSCINLQNVLTETTVGSKLFNNEKIVLIWGYTEEQDKYYDYILNESAKAKEEQKEKVEVLEAELTEVNTEISNLQDQKLTYQYYRDYINNEIDYYITNVHDYMINDDFDANNQFNIDNAQIVNDITNKYTTEVYGGNTVNETLRTEEDIVDFVGCMINGYEGISADGSFLQDGKIVAASSTIEVNGMQVIVTSTDNMILNYSKWIPLMTESEKEVFNYIYNTQGKKAAYQYLTNISGTLDQRWVANETQKDEAFAEKHPILASIRSVVETPIEGIAAACYSINALVTETDIMSSHIYSGGDIMRSKVGSDIAEEYGEGWAFLYNTGMSMADSAMNILMNSATGGANIFVSAVSMGSRSFVSSLNEAKDRGLSDGTAVAIAVTNSITETLLEHVSLTSLFNLDSSIGKVLTTDVMSFVSNRITDPNLARIVTNTIYTTSLALKQGLCEGLEEAQTTVVNNYVDRLIVKFSNDLTNGSALSNHTISINNYMNLGYSEEEARNLANKDFLQEIGKSFLGGFISGEIFGGIQGTKITNDISNRIANSIMVDYEGNSNQITSNYTNLFIDTIIAENENKKVVNENGRTLLKSKPKQNTQVETNNPIPIDSVQSENNNTTNINFAEEIAKANYYTARGNFYTLNVDSLDQIPQEFWSQIADPSQVYINVNGEVMTYIQAKPTPFLNVNATTNYDIDSQIAYANTRAQSGGFTSININSLEEMTNELWEKITNPDLTYINVNGTIMTFYEAQNQFNQMNSSNEEASMINEELSPTNDVDINVEYSPYTIEQIMSECSNYQEICNIFMDLTSDPHIKLKLTSILYKGGYKDYGFDSNLGNKNNPMIEGQRRLSMAYLLLRNPTTFDALIESKVNLFHGTNSNALSSILKYGINSVQESQKNGVDVLTGEKSTRINGTRDFVSFTDVLELAEDYSTLGPQTESEIPSFEIIIGTTIEDASKARIVTVRSDTPEVAIKNKLPLESIKTILVPSDKLELVKNMVNTDQIQVLAIDDISNKFYYIDEVGEITIYPEILDTLKNNLLNQQNINQQAEANNLESPIIDSIDDIKIEKQTTTDNNSIDQQEIENNNETNINFEEEIRNANSSTGKSNFYTINVNSLEQIPEEFWSQIKNPKQININVSGEMMTYYEAKANQEIFNILNTFNCTLDTAKLIYELGGVNVCTADTIDQATAILNKYENANVTIKEITKMMIDGFQIETVEKILDNKTINNTIEESINQYSLTKLNEIRTNNNLPSINNIGNITANFIAKYSQGLLLNQRFLTNFYQLSQEDIDIFEDLHTKISAFKIYTGPKIVDLEAYKQAAIDIANIINSSSGLKKIFVPIPNLDLTSTMRKVIKGAMEISKKNNSCNTKISALISNYFFWDTQIISEEQLINYVETLFKDYDIKNIVYNDGSLNMEVFNKLKQKLNNEETRLIYNYAEIKLKEILNKNNDRAMKAILAYEYRNQLRSLAQKLSIGVNTLPGKGTNPWIESYETAYIYYGLEQIWGQKESLGEMFLKYILNVHELSPQSTENIQRILQITDKDDFKNETKKIYQDFSKEELTILNKIFNTTYAAIVENSIIQGAFISNEGVNSSLGLNF